MIAADKVRGKSERFAEHYSQATLFWNSQTPIEKAHIIRGFRFELTRVQVPAIRRRVVSMLANVDNGLAETLKQAQREQKTSTKEIQSVRQTLRSLQSVRI